ncbi:BT4734/BF3469 family protein [Spirosoma sp. 209]|uniref:BT4734/BF3469 family protein n=1 Tax=Spirosoma sp. 209 TaxID=1955701 RepID=UPI00098D0B4B|nr:BT4734/BF3469 family protein [Spirosoma sp. 209]
MNKFTIFADFAHTDKPFFVTLEKVVERIKTGAIKTKIEELRTCLDPKEASRLKKLLPCICFSGQFMRRDDDSMTSHSGFIVLDFDHKPEKFYPVRDAVDWQARHEGTRLIESPDKPGYYALNIDNPGLFRDSLQQYPYLACAFISPSGTGVKAVARIPAVKSQHRGHYAAILREFEVLDSTSCNESRICFDSYDPNIWVGDEFAEFTDYIAPEDKARPTPPPTGKTATRTDYGKLNLCAAMIRNSADGGKHETLLKASRLAGGYVAAGLIDELVAIRMLEAEIENKANVDDKQTAFRTIRDGIEYGKRVPIYEQTPEEQPIPKTETRNGVIYLADVWELMDEGFHKGKARGETTHFEGLDEHFTWKKGEHTLLSGRPGSGKSEWILQMMLIKSVYAGWKWAIFSPESYPADEFYDTLIHTLVGKSTDPTYKGQMTLDEYEQGANFIQQHFFFIYPDTSHTIEEVEANMLHLHQKHGLAGVLIDPFNQLSRDFSMRDDQYLEVFVSTRQRMAREHQLCYITVAHPKPMQKNKDGEYDVVDAYDIANGAMWINKTDNFISVYRPNQSREPKDTSVEIHVKKIKRQKLVGTPGSVFWTFDRKTNRYYEDGKSPLSQVAIMHHVNANNN